VNTGHFPPGFAERLREIFVARPTARVLALLELLQAGGQHTVTSLAERLGIDERTVRRYAAHLVDLGIPIDAARGRYGGYRLAPGFKLPPLMLTDDEAVAVVLGLTTATPSPAASSATAKVRRVLPTRLAGRIDALMSTMDVTSTPRPRVPPATDVLLTLADAARRHRTVTLSYTAWRGRASIRDLDPYGLVLHSGRWYLTGWDHDTTEIRTFRLDRIRSAEATSRPFTPPDDFDPVRQVLAGLAAVPYTHEISVVLYTDAATARGRIPVSVATLTEVPGGVRLTTRAERLAGAAEMLAGLGFRFTVERPAELRDEIRALAHRLVAAAGEGS
jgi:predicted DNA-binding transcriptional regulator YafY